MTFYSQSKCYYLAGSGKLAALGYSSIICGDGGVKNA